MFKKKKKEDLKADMQSENIYLVSQISDMDWTSLKGFDTFLLAFLEIGYNNSALRPIIDIMTANGFNIDESKKTLNVRKSLRKRIVGDKDVTRIKEQHILNVEEIKTLKIEIQYYKDMVKSSNKRPYPELEFKQKTDRLKTLEDLVLDNAWAGHPLT